MATVCRRASDPHAVQQLWGAIKFVRAQKQIANEDRIVRHVRRELGDSVADVASVQLHRAVDDGLIVTYRANQQKLCSDGMEQVAYRIPDEDLVNGDHDWYCFECHGPGEVLECTECWRVYHPSCVKSVAMNFVCAVCKEIGKGYTLKSKELNCLLSFTVIRLKEKSTALHWFGGAELGLGRFVHHYLDLNTMQTRTHDGYYSNLEQFYADCCTIRHNIFVCFGDTGILQDLARIMIRDCRYDLDEIKQCKDCYYNSNKKNKDWFCMPCNPPHELVFAKQKGFCYWPAKVIQITGNEYDVRFFGARHQRFYECGPLRIIFGTQFTEVIYDTTNVDLYPPHLSTAATLSALVTSSSIRPIDTSVQSLGVKRTAGFVRACGELARHREQLACPPLNSDDSSDENDSLDIASSRRKVFAGKSEPASSVSLWRGVSSEPGSSLTVSSTRRRRHSSMNKSSRKRPAESQFTEDSSVVSSSEDRSRLARTFHMSNVAVQTVKMMSVNENVVDSSAQTDSDMISSCGPDCEARFEVKLRDFRARIERELNDQMQVAMRKLEERMRKESEEDKQRAVAHAVATRIHNVELACQQADKHCQDEFEAERKRITQAHAAEISAVKKKQWCYNCESEAMYHCCWNTSYCSIKCQQEHWHREHKRVCRRKRT